MAPRSFYAAKTVEQEEEQARLRMSLPQTAATRAAPPPTFPRQSLAVDYLRAEQLRRRAPGVRGSALRIWAREYSASGARSFMVASARSFWHEFYTRLAPGQRHCYEIILEGQPACLYFDLEFSAESNPGLMEACAETILDTFVAVVALRVSEAFGIMLGPQDFLRLLSSTPQKFSAHVIVPKVVFRDTSHVGRFVKDLAARLWPHAGSAASGSLLGLLWVRPPPPRKRRR